MLTVDIVLLIYNNSYELINNKARTMDNNTEITEPVETPEAGAEAEKEMQWKDNRSFCDIMYNL